MSTVTVVTQLFHVAVTVVFTCVNFVLLHTEESLQPKITRFYPWRKSGNLAPTSQKSQLCVANIVGKLLNSSVKHAREQFAEIAPLWIIVNITTTLLLTLPLKKEKFLQVFFKKQKAKSRQ